MPSSALHRSQHADPQVLAMLAPDEKLLFSARVSLWNYVQNFLFMGIAVVASLFLFLLDTSTLESLADRWSEPGAPIYNALSLFATFWDSWWSLLVKFLPLGIGGINLMNVLQGYYSIRLILTDSRVIITAGIIAQQSVDISVDHVESLRVSQTGWGRLGHFGTVIVHGVGDTVTAVYGICDPLLFKQRLTERQQELAREAAQRRVS